jgi:hypothetical protein
MPDLGNDVLIAIGSVSAEWATLEYYMSRVTLSAYDKYGKAPSRSLASISFYERQKAFRHAFEGENVAEDERKFAQEIADKIGLAENKRHKIIHGMANAVSRNDVEDFTSPDKVFTFLRDHPKHFFAERFTVDEIAAIASEIASINADMVKLYFSLWLSSHDGV